jgi:predicted DNA-binding transcriptional regulator YafY
MAKKRISSRAAAEDRASVTPERFDRLHLLLVLLAKAPQTREVLARRLKLDVRGFYRDLEVLRQAGVTIVLDEGRYYLTETLDAARQRLPFPDPMLTLGEALQLAKGRSAAHRRLQKRIADHIR